MNPTAIDSLLQQATRALNAGAYAELQQLCRQILQLDRNQPDAWFFMSIVAEAVRQIGHALQCVDRALQFSPYHVEYLTQKAKLHSLLNEYQPARLAADQVAATRPQRAILLDTLGVIYTRLGLYQQARTLLAQAAGMEPGNAQFQFNLGSAEQFLGHEEAARRAYGAAISAKPDFSRAFWALSELEKNQPASGRLQQLLSLQAGRSSSSDRLYLAHAIAREYEKLGEYDLAFASLESAKRQRKAELNYRVENDLALFNTITATFEHAPPREAEDDVLSGHAVFVVGMPRTGTTLLERMLCAHSQVVTLGELQDFPRALKEVAGTSSPLVLDNDTVQQAARADMQTLGAAYARLLADRAPAGLRFIDKLPLNFYCVGFILAALPQSRVICLRRNALDTCLSNYRQLFALNFSYYNYHYDLADTAQLYVAFHRLMQFWQSSYPGRFLQVEYENLVAKPEPSIRDALEYLSLDWEPACLSFHDQSDPVATASASQVRQPLYSSAIGRWKHYESHLAPAMSILDDAGIRYR